MGYGTTIMIIILFVNLLVYLGTLATQTDDSNINSGIISTVSDLASGNVTSAIQGLIPTISNYSGTITVIGLILGVIIALASLTGSIPLLSGGGYGVTQLPLIVGLFVFLSFATIPNFSAMGFPAPVDTVFYVVFGIMLAVGFYGVIRGE